MTITRGTVVTAVLAAALSSGITIGLTATHREAIPGNVLSAPAATSTTLVAKRNIRINE